MAAGKCCCCTIRQAAIVAGNYAMVAYGAACGATVWWIIESKGNVSIPMYVVVGIYFVLFILSIILVLAMSLQKYLPLVLLWIIAMVVFLLPECGLNVWIYVWELGIRTPKGLGFFIYYACRATINLICICVVHLYYSQQKRAEKQKKHAKNDRKNQTKEWLSDDMLPQVCCSWNYHPYYKYMSGYHRQERYNEPDYGITPYSSFPATSSLSNDYFRLNHNKPSTFDTPLATGVLLRHRISDVRNFVEKLSGTISRIRIGNVRKNSQLAKEPSAADTESPVSNSRPLTTDKLESTSAKRPKQLSTKDWRDLATPSTVFAADGYRSIGDNYNNNHNNINNNNSGRQYLWPSEAPVSYDYYSPAPLSVSTLLTQRPVPVMSKNLYSPYYYRTPPPLPPPPSHRYFRYADDVQALRHYRLHRWSGPRPAVDETAENVDLETGQIDDGQSRQHRRNSLQQSQHHQHHHHHHQQHQKFQHHHHHRRSRENDNVDEDPYLDNFIMKKPVGDLGSFQPKSLRSDSRTDNAESSDRFDVDSHQSQTIKESLNGYQELRSRYRNNRPTTQQSKHNRQKIQSKSLPLNQTGKASLVEKRKAASSTALTSNENRSGFPRNAEHSDGKFDSSTYGRIPTQLDETTWTLM